MTSGVITIFVILWTIYISNSIFIDKGNPYHLGPLMVGKLTLDKTIQGAPYHTEVFFPVQPGDYPPIFYIGGLNGLVLAELYEDFEAQLASHGFVVFGVDTYFPFLPATMNVTAELGVDINLLFKHMDWLRNYMIGRTEARIAWNSTALLCHSAGCDSTLKMILQNHTVAKASVFLEPASSDVNKQVPVNLPILSYGTQLSEEAPQCALRGMDWRQFYKIFSCPRVLIEVKDFGHCDILDPVGWEACHDVHFCKTTNNSRNAEYRRFVQGAVAAFLIGTMEDYKNSLNYILNRTLIPLELLDLQYDLNCI